MIIAQGGTDLDVSVFLGDFGPHSEGVTGKTTTELIVYAAQLDTAPSTALVAATEITMVELDSTNLPGWYTLTFDVSDLGWDAGETWAIYFKCGETVPTFMEPPSVRVMFTTHDPTDIPTVAAIADAVLQESVDDHKATVNSLAEHIDEIQADTAAIEPLVSSNVDATISSRATQASVDTVDGNVDAIKLDTDAYLDETVSSRASQASVDTVDGNVDAIKLDTDAYLDETVSSRASQASLDAHDTALSNHDSNIDGDVAAVKGDTSNLINALQIVDNEIAAIQGDVTSLLTITGNIEDEVDRPQVIAQWSIPTFLYPGVETKFSVSLYDAKTGAAIPAADISCDDLLVQRSTEGGAAFQKVLQVTSGTGLNIEDGLVWYDYDVGAGDGPGGESRIAQAGDMIRWSIQNLVVTTGDSPKRSYQITPVSSYGPFFYGKCLSEPTSGSGGGATVEEIFDTEIQEYQRGWTAGGILNLLNGIVPKIRDTVNRIWRTLGGG